MEARFARFYPSSASPVSLTFSIYGRPSKGTGSFSLLIPAMTLAYNGHGEGVPWSQICDAFVSYALESGFGSMVSPRAGRGPGELLHDLLSTLPATFNTGTVRVFCDGSEDIYIA